MDAEASFTIAYEAMLKITLALVNFSKYILKEKFSRITSTYDKMRQKRNKLIYDDSFVSQAESTNALEIAKRYYRIVKNKIVEDNPQQELWRPKKL